jgi:hypothetical protein
MNFPHGNFINRAVPMRKSSMTLVSDLATDFFIIHHLDKSSRSDGVRYLIGRKGEKDFRNPTESNQFFSAHIPFIVLGIAMHKNCPVPLLKQMIVRLLPLFPCP